MARQVNTPRRRKQWTSLLGGGPLNFTAVGSGGISNLAFGDGGNTILRMMGEYIITSVPMPVAADGCVITAAIGIFSTDAVTAGVSTAFPDFTAELEYPWLYWASHAFAFETADVDSNAAAGQIRHTFDVRSQRKVSPRQSLAWVFEYGNFAGNPAMNVWAGATRVLLALP